MLALIVAYSKNRVIGKDGCIPWDIKGDKRHFKELTMGKVVIMGRKTFEEIGKPLPGREMIVVSSTKDFSFEHCKTVPSLKEALLEVKGRDAFIAGGQRLYEEALDLVDMIYLTEIDLVVEGDRFFPEFSKEIFEKVEEIEIKEEISYRYLTYRRKGSFKMEDIIL